MTETKWCKHIQLNAPLQRKSMSVTWDDFCVVRHIFKTCLCLLSVFIKTQNCLTHRIYRPAFFCFVVFNWLHTEINDKITDNYTRQFVINQFINFYICDFVYRAGINVKNESSKQIFLCNCKRNLLKFEHVLVVHTKYSNFTVTRGIISS